MNQLLQTISCLPLLCWGGAASYAAAPVRPNILIIHTDEHNFRTLGCYRETLPRDQAYPWGKDVSVETPNIDGLARQGVLFKHCYATSPVSSPSRASFLTGLYAPRNGVYTNDMELTKEEPTFADILRENGYATGYIGKLHLDGKPRPEWHPARDFGFTDNRYMYNRGHWKKIVETDDLPEFRPNENVRTADAETFPTDYFTNRAIEYIHAHKDSAFCCLVAYPDPHSANQVRPPYDTMYKHLPFQTPSTAALDTTNLPSWCHGNKYPEDQPEDMAQYFGMVKCIDDNIGRLLAALQEAGVLDRTLIVFTSDHGDMCGQHGLINKGVPLDDSARVPFIVCYPKGLPEGIQVEPVVSVADFTPSLLSICRIKSHESFDGRDLSAIWKGKKLPDSYKDITFMRAPTTTMVKSDWDESRIAPRSLWIAAVTPRYKLVYSEYETDRPWLIDLEKDPDETVNRYNSPAYHDTVVQLASALLSYGKQHNDPRIRHPKIAAEIENVLTSKNK